MLPLGAIGGVILVTRGLGPGSSILFNALMQLALDGNITVSSLHGWDHGGKDSSKLKGSY